MWSTDRVAAGQASGAVRRAQRAPLVEEVLRLSATGMSARRVADDVGVGQATISRWLAAHGMHGRNFRFLDELTPRQEAILTGTLLGDANLQLRGLAKNATLRLSHGDKQIDYLRWKADELRPLITAAPKLRWIKHPEKDDYKGWVAHSRSHPLLTAFFRAFYPDGVKSISEEVVQKMSAVDIPLEMAVWYMDDGCLDSGKYALLSIGGLDESSYGRIFAWLQSRFPGRPRKCASNCYIYALTKPGSDELFRAIAAHVHPSMRYKLPEAYRA